MSEANRRRAIEILEEIRANQARQLAQQAEGLALLQAFIREVPAKTGPPVREVLLARGYRALEIVTTP